MAWPGSARIKAPKRARKDLWVGYSPNGIGHQKPNHFLDMAKTVWVNRHHLPFAWRILSKGVCDGCALGVRHFQVNSLISKCQSLPSVMRTAFFSCK